MKNATDKSLQNRALIAYMRSAERIGGSPMQPSPGTIMTVNEKKYVVLSNINGILAVYRVRTDGVLKALIRWPTEITQAFSR